ncbi:MAG: CADD family putative folate metabolism protein [Chlamydiae bacterium]|nr:CADD family putative folate metabolism protein [Chlamydiota bacterium]
MKEPLINKIDALIQTKHLLLHPFYQAWSRGELSLECLQDYAQNYYHHVKAFPTYLSALHSHTEDAQTRRLLLQNLIDEEAGCPNHPDLWQNFVKALGVSESDLMNHTPSPSIETLIQTFRAICLKHTTVEGIAALYAYESQIPAICISKIAGLKEHYQIQRPPDLEYFSVHIAADTKHAADERSLLESYMNLDNQESVCLSVDRILDVLGGFLSSLCQKYAINCPSH